MTDEIEATGEALARSLAEVREAEPLVQQLTNEVTKNDLANVTLSWGALPVMADAPGEAPEMAELAGAILLNTGRMTGSNVDALHAAGKAANGLDVPVVLDPVGAGTTPTRKEVHTSLLEEVEFDVINGNYGEITHLAGEEADVKGVESVGEYEEVTGSARALAETTGAVVVASGVEDVVAGSDRVYRVRAGDEMLSKVVGTGCMLGATLAAFAGGHEDAFSATLHGTLAYGLAGERATDLEYNGPASYRVNFLDSIAGFTPEVAEGLDPTDPSWRVRCSSPA